MQPGPEDLVRAAARLGVSDQRVLDALGAIRREQFVPPVHRSLAYVDRPIPIAHGQVTTQPSLVAVMVEALDLRGTERVLEVGTGLGYQAAVLAQLAAEVWSIERFASLAEAAGRNLEQADVSNVTVVVGDGTLGMPGRAPYHAIVVAAASVEVPQPLIEQLVVGGRLVQPVGPGGAEDVTLFARDELGLRRVRSVIGAHFVRLYGQHGFAP